MIRIIEHGDPAVFLPDQRLHAVSIGEPPFVAVHQVDANGRYITGFQTYPDHPLVIEYAECIQPDGGSWEVLR